MKKENKNMNRKLLSLLLALALLLTMLPQAAPAARAEDKAGKDPYSGWCGEYLTWSFDPETGVLAISGEGSMWNFWGSKGDGSNSPIPWLAFQEQITGLELAEGLSSIGDNAFQDCLHLKSAVLPETVTRIGWYAFNGCSDLRELEISGGVTEIGGYAFSSCTGLTEVVLPGSLETIEEAAFASCTGLTSVTFLSLGGYFAEDCLSGCGELTIYGYNGSTAERFAEEQGFPFVSLGDCVVEGVCGDNLTWSLNSGTGLLTIEGEGDMWDFWGNKGDGFISSNTEPWNAYRSVITGLSLPEGLTSIGDVAFNGCWRLNSVVIPGNVTRIGEYAFGACDELSEVVIPEGVIEVGESAFEFCTSLTEAVLPESVEYVGSWAFAFCFDLSSITFLNPTCIIPDDCLDYTQNVTVCGYTGSTAELFAAEQNLPFVPLGDFTAEGVCGDNLTWSFASATGLLTIEGSGDMWDFWGNKGDGFISSNTEPWNAYRSVITGLSLPEGLTSIGDVAFNGCWRLNSVVIPGNVTRIGEYAFGACDELREVVISEGVTTIADSAFEFCTSLSEVVLPASVQLVDSYAFAACFELSAITFLNPECNIAPDCLGYSDNATVFGYSGSTAEVFAAEQGLRFVPLGDFTVEGTCGDDLTWSFDSTTGLLTIEGSGDMWDYEYWMPAPWYNYTSLLTAVSFPAGLTGVGAYAFSRCYKLSEAFLPEGVTEIRDHAFSTCRALSALALPQSLTFIGEGAMEDCQALTAIAIPDNVVVIDGYAFSSCDNLSQITFPASLETIGKRAFWFTALTSVVLPDGLVSIGDQAFSNCSSLEKATIPKRVQNIGEDVFMNCYSLKQVVFRNPDTLTVAYEHVYNYLWTGPEDSDEDLDDSWWDWVLIDEYPYENALGIPGSTAVYGPHDPERETAEPIEDPIDHEKEEEFPDYYKYNYGYRYLENYAKTYGYTFYATNVFEDVKEGKFYELPVAWAYGEGVTAGKDETHFGPNETCTRGQVVTFLWNAMGKPEPTITDCPFVDVKPGKYYYDAMLWALETGVTSGKDETHFAPNESCTRGQVVTFIWNAMGKPEPTITDCPFVDVTPGKYYYNAMLWALENGITAGLDETHFGPNQTCTRGQVVTFLYNALS